MGGGNAEYDDGGGGILSESFVNATTLTIANNVIRNNFGGFNPPLYAYNAWHATIVQNLVYGNLSSSGPAGLAVGVDPQFAPRGLTFLLTAANNTSYGNMDQNDAANRPTQRGNQAAFGATNLSVENGLFIATDAYGTLECASTIGGTLTASNNDSFYAGATQPMQCGTAGDGNLAVDPEFLNPGANDFHTQRTSPVVYAGNAEAPGLPATDLDGRNRTVCGKVDMGVYQTHPIPPISLGSSSNPSVGGTPVTLSAHVEANCNIPTGALSFFDGANPLGVGTLDSSGNTTLVAPSLTVGTHAITATYPGDFNFDPSTSPIFSQVVTGYPTTTTLVSVSPNPVNAFQAISLSASVSSQFGVPTGTVTFLANGKAIASANLNGAGAASASVSSLGAGTYTIAAQYNASIYYAASLSNAMTEVVDGAPTATTLVSSADPSAYGQAVTFTATVTAVPASAIPAGTVTFRDGSATLGSATLNAAGSAPFTIATLAAGSHPITAVYSGAPNDNASSSPGLNQVVAPVPATIALGGTPNPASIGQTVTLTASVAFGGLPAGTGSVAFADQFGPLGTATATNGQAVLQTSQLAVGTHNITASIQGSGNFTGAISPVLAEVVEAHDFAIALAPATLTVVSGQQGQTEVMLTSLGSYAGTLNLAAAQIPQYAGGTFSPASTTLAAGSSVSAQLSVSTASLPPGVGRNRAPGRDPRLAFVSALACCLLPFLVRRRRSGGQLLALLAALALSASLCGCSNIAYPLNRVAPGTYTIPIQATDPTGQLTHTASLTLIVKPS